MGQSSPFNSSVPVAELVDPTLWRERYAWGLALGPGDVAIQRGRTRCAPPAEAASEFSRLTASLPPETIRWHLRTALSALEVQLGIPLGITVVKSPNLDEGAMYDRLDARRPFLPMDSIQFLKIDLPGPVISVERIRAYYFGLLQWQWSTNMETLNSVRVEWKAGNIHIVPLNLGVAAAGMDPSIFSLIQRFGPTNVMVDFWSVDYTLGPIDRNGHPGQVPAAAAHWVYCQAALTLFPMIGTAITKGLSGTSVSIDGVSRSVSVSGEHVYSAVEQAAQRATELLDVKRLRAALRGPRVWSYGA